MWVILIYTYLYVLLLKNNKTLLLLQVTVNEDWIARAILRLVEQEKYVVEGGGAVCVAAIMAGLVEDLGSKK